MVSEINMNKVKVDKIKAQVEKLNPKGSKVKMLARKYKLDLTPVAPEILSTVPIESEPVKKTVKKKA